MLDFKRLGLAAVIAGTMAFGMTSPAVSTPVANILPPQKGHAIVTPPAFSGNNSSDARSESATNAAISSAFEASTSCLTSLAVRLLCGFKNP